MVAGGLFNAFAFAGAGYLFKMINSDGYGEEIKRHNLAMEQLARARQEWNQKEIEQRRKQLELRQERSDANVDFKEINKSLKDYKKVSDLEIIYNGKKNYTRTTHMGLLPSIRRNERVHDASHRNDGIGWWMDRWKDYLPITISEANKIYIPA